MNAGPPDFGSAPLTCEGFRTRVHVRDGLARGELRAFEQHAGACLSCGRLLLEVERLDDLLLHWHAPDPAPASGDGNFVERVLRAVHGDGPTAGCAETTASLHHFVAGDLEPWLAARVERHLAKCAGCRDHLDEIRHSRKVWLTWLAPEPAEGFAERILERLEPETRAARRRKRVFELLFGAVPVPRIAAALVLASLTLLAVGVLHARLGSTRPAILSAPDDLEHAFTQNTLQGTIVPARFEPQAGRSDPTDSFSPDLRAGRRGSLRRALRGE